MIVLGVTDPIGEDNAAAVLVDGQLVAMVEEERLNRVKHAPNMPPVRRSPGVSSRPRLRPSQRGPDRGRLR